MKVMSIILSLFLVTCSSQNEQTIKPIPVVAQPPKVDLFLLNKKDTVYVEKCSCSIRRLPMESGAGAFGDVLIAHFTPESDREFELTCKGKITNKTQYKLQNVQLQWEYLSATKFPIEKGPVREYQNNYILPKATTNVSLLIGKNSGIKNFFTKEAKHYECKIISVVETASGDTIQMKE
ncbi:hypothetical protein [Leptospira noguchii]|uniref:Lipoprotein n=1 Tax=Leptospira noguchii TaxID=28182 RepID=A0AAE9KBP7_9LEPT|nr:hypothetical protein [Leptospira noguchii]UOG31847.1 hypothetical protein MAL06_07615 [Leptospira noguchii]UOG51363.1 hypothetical protein MAL09_11635 [Leptospira noguchii]UOG57947.1 hypothetical protein MAL03_07495 [Leptospira noguchii]